MTNTHNLISIFSQHSNWPEVKKIILTLNKNSFTAYLAGGCVRDALLNQFPKDFDIATSATAEEVLRLFPRGNKQGKAFGVVAIFCSKGSVEVATFRKDGPYADGRHPQYVEFLSEKQDALRRDFTVNALFYDLKTDKVIDYVGGIEDLRKKIIRTVGEPEQRFQEDHLRILRAIRFSIKLDFEIESLTQKSLFKMKEALLKISRERIYEECLKILNTGNFTRAVLAFKDLGLLNYFLSPLVSEKTFNNRAFWKLCLEFWKAPLPVELMNKKILWTYVFFPIVILMETEGKSHIIEDKKQKKDFSDNLKNWKFPFASIRAVNNILYSSYCILGFKKVSLGKKLIMLNTGFSKSILFLCRNYLKICKFKVSALSSVKIKTGIDKLCLDKLDLDKLEKEFISRAKDGKLALPLINGEDLKALGIVEDKNMALMLESLYEKQLEQKIKDKKTLLELLK